MLNARSEGQNRTFFGCEKVRYEASHGARVKIVLFSGVKRYDMRPRTILLQINTQSVTRSVNDFIKWGTGWFTCIPTKQELSQKDIACFAACHEERPLPFDVQLIVQLFSPEMLDAELENRLPVRVFEV